MNNREHTKREYHKKPIDFKAEPVFPAGHPKEGMSRCIRWNGYEQRQCNNSPVKNNTVCHKHGAGSPGKGRPGGRPPKKKLLDCSPRTLLFSGNKTLEDLVTQFSEDDLTSYKELLMLDAVMLRQIVNDYDVGAIATILKRLKEMDTEIQRVKSLPQGTDNEKRHYQSERYYAFDYLSQKIEEAQKYALNQRDVRDEARKQLDVSNRLRVGHTKQQQIKQQYVELGVVVLIISKLVQIAELKITENVLDVDKREQEIRSYKTTVGQVINPYTDFLKNGGG